MFCIYLQVAFVDIFVRIFLVITAALFLSSLANCVQGACGGVLLGVRDSFGWAPTLLHGPGSPPVRTRPRRRRREWWRRERVPRAPKEEPGRAEHFRQSQAQSRTDRRKARILWHFGVCFGKDVFLLDKIPLHLLPLIVGGGYEFFGQNMEFSSKDPTVFISKDPHDF